MSDTDGAAVAGLAREVEALRRSVDDLVGLRGRVEEIAELVARLCETAAAGSGGGEQGPAGSWLGRRGDAQTAARLLDRLVGWLDRVYLRYADAAAGLPECWLWHCEVVEELVWLMCVWEAAYDPDTGSVQRAADFHDRLRPGVVRRIGEHARNCSLDRHRTPADEPAVPLAAAAELIAAWWATEADPAPAPTPQLRAAADALHRARGGRP